MAVRPQPLVQRTIEDKVRDILEHEKDDQGGSLRGMGSAKLKVKDLLVQLDPSQSMDPDVESVRIPRFFLHIRCLISKN
jgi:hypothetical protein